MRWCIRGIVAGWGIPRNHGRISNSPETGSSPKIQLDLTAGKLDGEQHIQDVVTPFANLLIGVTALSLGYSVWTANVRHFQMISR